MPIDTAEKVAKSFQVLHPAVTKLSAESLLELVTEAVQCRCDQRKHPGSLGHFLWHCNTECSAGMLTINTDCLLKHDGDNCTAP